MRIFAKIEDWYVIQTSNDIIGAVKAEYIEIVDGTHNIETSAKENLTSELTEEEQTMLDLINAERAKNNINKLELDDDLQNVARLKAREMVEKNYFSHTSPTYGSPFYMLKQFRNHIQNSWRKHSRKPQHGSRNRCLDELRRPQKEHTRQ